MVPMNAMLCDYVTCSGQTMWLLTRGCGGIGLRAVYTEFKVAVKEAGNITNYGDYVEITKEPCVLTMEDDPNTWRAKLKCGCVYCKYMPG